MVGALEHGCVDFALLPSAFCARRVLNTALFTLSQNSAFTLELRHLPGKVATVVCDSSESAQRWVSTIKRQLPQRVAAGVRQLAGGKRHERFIAWLQSVLFVFEDEREGKLVQMLPASDVHEVVLDGRALGIISDSMVPPRPAPKLKAVSPTATTEWTNRGTVL